jgi:thiopurine S-methyltransferase
MDMDRNFWLQKWKTNQIAFHNGEVHPLLIEYFDTLAQEKGARVFVPLCGKTRDLAWLISQNYLVVGVELSETAVEQVFSEINVSPVISAFGRIRRYSAQNIEIFVGDIFDLSKELLGPVHAIYDRAALVALPKEMRQRYTIHLKQITDAAPQLLICYEYDQSLMDGPPFHISFDEIKKHYEGSYDVTHLATVEVPSGIKGLVPAKETIYQVKTREISR